MSHNLSLKIKKLPPQNLSCLGLFNNTRNAPKNFNKNLSFDFIEFLFFNSIFNNSIHYKFKHYEITLVHPFLQGFTMKPRTWWCIVLWEISRC